MKLYIQSIYIRPIKPIKLKIGSKINDYFNISNLLNNKRSCKHPRGSNLVNRYTEK